MNLPTPYVLGFAFSGEVVKVAPDGGDALKPGDAILGRTMSGGGFAKYIVVKSDDVVLRGGVPAAEASTFGVAYLTAYESLVIAANVQQHRGKFIYVAGAAGGVGHFATQIAKLYGLKVIGTAGKANSLQLLRDLHVDHVIDYSKQDVTQEIMKITGGKGADVVYDSTYTQSSFVQSSAVIASGGVYIRLGNAQQLARSGTEDMTPVVQARGAKMIIGDLGRYSHEPAYQARSAELIKGLKQGVSWYEEGKIKPVITATVAFDASALQRTFEAFLKGTNNVGKVVVECGS